VHYHLPGIRSLRVEPSNAMGKEIRYTGGMSMNSVVFYGVPFVFLGIVKERDLAGCEVYARRYSSRSYRKIVTRGNRLVGAVLAGNIDTPECSTGTSGRVAWLMIHRHT
jgi:NAD(P)H-nitrite reductase large subunit